MQRIYVFVFCSVLGLLPAVHVLPAHAEFTPLEPQLDGPAGVVISEINWGGSSRGIADEWFALANRDAQPADISGWTVTGVATGGTAITFSADTIIPAYGSYLIANYAPGDDSVLTVTADLVTTAVSIPNTKLTVTLATQDGTVVDSLIDPGTPDFGSSVSPYASMERDPLTLAWHTAVHEPSESAAQPEAPEDAQTPVTTEATIDEPFIDVQQPVETDDAAATDNPPPPTTDVENSEDADEAAIDAPVPDVGTTTDDEDTATIETHHSLPCTGGAGAGEVESVMTDPEFTLDVMLEAGLTVEASELPTSAPPATDSADQVLSEEMVPSEDLDLASIDDENIATVEDESAAAALPIDTDTLIADPAADSSEGESIALVTEETPQANDVVIENIGDDTPPASDTATTTQEQTVSILGAVQINEIFVDGDEWIEVRNTDTHDIDVSTWVVRDASGKETSLGAHILAPDALLVIDAPKGKLNNDSDVVELVDGTGLVIDQVQYGTDALAAPDNSESLVRAANGWFVLTTITKGETNPIIIHEAEEGATLAATSTATPPSATQDPSETTPSSLTYVAPANTAASVVIANAVAPSASAASAAATDAAKPATHAKAASKTTTKSASAVKKSSTSKKPTKKAVTTVTNIQTTEDGARVRYTGTVIALPGTFGSQVMFLDGASVYFYRAEWPSMTTGDVVTVEGEVSTTRGERRIKIATVADIVIADRAEISPSEIAVFDAAAIARLVRINGTISAREGDVLTVLHNGSAVRVVASTQSGIRWSTLTGTRVAITGVVRHLDGEYVLMPRTVDDVTVQHDEAIAPAPATPQFPTRSVLGGGVLTSTAGLLGYWFVRSRALIPSL